jgi:hypothetical protein
MKSIEVFAIAIGVCIMLTASISINYEKPMEVKNESESQGFAVLELFTSEGCSSCPPAETVLKEIQQEYKNKPVYIVAFHVDYWNHLGWKDQFSQEAFTERQRQYSYILGSGSLYTPQLIINGTKEFVGSSKRAIVEEINANLTSQSTETLKLNCSLNQDKLTVQYEGAIPNKPAELVLALVQKTARSNVKAGENSGRNLSHIQIVRSLLRSPFEPSRPVTMTVPNDFSTNDYELIGFVQRKTNRQTILAGRFDFNSLR